MSAALSLFSVDFFPSTFPPSPRHTYLVLASEESEAEFLALKYLVRGSATDAATLTGQPAEVIIPEIEHQTEPRVLKVWINNL
jgi:hypothetical protein